MVKKYRIFIICILIIGIVSFIGLNYSSNADTGAKPSITIKLKNIATSNYIIDLFEYAEENEDYYPDSNYSNNNRMNGVNRVSIDKNEIIVYFDEIAEQRRITENDAENLYYKDYDGWISSCTRKSFLWGGCAGNSDYSHFFTYFGTPEIYKVYIYNKDTGEEKITNIIERIDFASDITIDYETMEVINNISDTDRMRSEVFKNIFPIIYPMIITILTELFILFCLGMINKKNSKIVLITNIITNFILQVILVSMDKIKGLSGAFELNCFFFLEIFILIIEASVYLKLLRNIDNKKKIIVYAILANFVSAYLTFYEWLVILPMFNY